MEREASAEKAVREIQCKRLCVVKASRTFAPFFVERG